MEEKIIEGSRGLSIVLFHRLAEHIQRGAIDGSYIELKRKKAKTFYDSLHCLRQEAINQKQGHGSRSQNRSPQHRLDGILVWPGAAFDTAAFPQCGVKYSGDQWHRGRTHNSSTPVPLEGTVSPSFSSCFLASGWFMIFHYWQKKKKGRQRSGEDEPLMLCLFLFSLSSLLSLYIFFFPHSLPFLLLFQIKG